MTIIEQDSIYDRYCQLAKIPEGMRVEARTEIEKTYDFQKFNLDNAIQLFGIVLVKTLDQALSRLMKRTKAAIKQENKTT